jgi:Divergent InlB B-repeat domain
MGSKEKIKAVITVALFVTVGIFILAIPKNTRDLASQSLFPPQTTSWVWDPNPETCIAGYVVCYWKEPLIPSVNGSLFWIKKGSESKFPIEIESSPWIICRDVWMESSYTITELDCNSTYRANVTAYSNGACNGRVDWIIVLSGTSSSISYQTPPCDGEPPITPPPPPLKHLICTPLGACALADGPGISECLVEASFDPDCTGEVPITPEDPPYPKYPIECPEGQEMKEIKTYSVEISYDLQTWTQHIAPDVWPNFDVNSEMLRLAYPPDGDPSLLPNYPPLYPKAWLRIKVVTETKCMPIWSPSTTGLKSSFLGSEQTEWGTTSVTESLWFQVWSWISSSFKFSWLTSSFLETPSGVNILLNNITFKEKTVAPIMRNVQVITSGSSWWDSIIMSGDLGNEIPVNWEKGLRMSVPQGTQLIFTAVAGPDSIFVEWKGGCKTTTGNTCSLKATKAKWVTAVFKPVPKYTLTTSTSGTGKWKISGLKNPLFGYSDISALLMPGSNATVTAVPNPGSIFTGWTWACTGKANSCTITMTSNKNITASFESMVQGVCWSKINTCTTGNFADISDTSSHYRWSCNGLNSGSNTNCSLAKPMYTLKTSKVGSGGIYRETKLFTTGSFYPGSTLSLTAKPSSGYVFVSWAGCRSTSANICNISMTGNKSVTATFKRKP